MHQAIFRGKPMAELQDELSTAFKCCLDSLTFGISTNPDELGLDNLGARIYKEVVRGKLSKLREQVDKYNKLYKEAQKEEDFKADNDLMDSLDRAFPEQYVKVARTQDPHNPERIKFEWYFQPGISARGILDADADIYRVFAEQC